MTKQIKDVKENLEPVYVKARDYRKEGNRELKYFEAGIPVPICNHNPELVEACNVGYTTGIISDGTPFEAEIWEENDKVGLSIFLPLYPLGIQEYIEKHKAKERDRKELVVDGEKLVDHMLEDIMEYSWASVLAQGMEEYSVDTDNDVIIYANYLEKAGIFKYTTKVCNGVLHFLTDLVGNRIVCLDVLLMQDGTQLAGTNLKFNLFEKPDVQAINRANTILQ